MINNQHCNKPTQKSNNKHTNYAKFKNFCSSALDKCTTRYKNNSNFSRDLISADGEYASTEYFFLEEDGKFSKKFKKGCKTKGAFSLIGCTIQELGDQKEVFIIGGFADAIAIVEFIPNAIVLVAGGEGQCLGVAKAALEYYPDLDITMVFDNDEAGIENQEKSRFYKTVVPPAIKGVKDFDDLKRLNKHSEAIEALKNPLNCYGDYWELKREQDEIKPRSASVVLQDIYSSSSSDERIGMMMQYFAAIYNRVIMSFADCVENLRACPSKNLNNIISDQEWADIAAVWQSMQWKKQKELKPFYQLQLDIPVLELKKSGYSKEEFKKLAELRDQGDADAIKSLEAGLNDEDLKFSGMHKRQLLKHDLLLLDWQLGRGKTQKAIAEVLSSTAGKKVYLTYSRSLTITASNKLNLKNYEDIKAGYVSSDHNTSFAVCLPSLEHQIIKQCNVSDQVSVLVLDEAVEIVNQLVSKLCKPLAYEEFIKLLRNADQVIVADANLNDFVINFLNSIRAFKKPILLKKKNFFKNNIYYYIQDRQNRIEYFLCNIIKTVAKGHACQLAIESIKDADFAKSFLLTMNSKLKILHITENTSNDQDVEKFFSNPNKYAKKYDIIIHTSSLSSGVSVEIDHVKYCFLIYSGVALTPQQAIQMLARFRSVKNISMFFKVNKMQRNESPLTLLKRDIAVKNAKSFNSSILVEDADAYMQLKAKVNAEQHKHKNNYILLTSLIAEHNGYKMVPAYGYDDVAKLVAKLKEDREDYNNKIITSILAADNINTDQYNSMELNKTEENKYMRMKYKIRKAYNLPAIKAEVEGHERLVRKYFKGYHRQIRNYSFLNQIKKLDLCKEDGTYYDNPFSVVTITYLNETYKNIDIKNTILKEDAEKWWARISKKNMRLIGVALGVLPEKYINLKSKMYDPLGELKRVLESKFGFSFLRSTVTAKDMPNKNRKARDNIKKYCTKPETIAQLDEDLQLYLSSYNAIKKHNDSDFESNKIINEVKTVTSTPYVKPESKTIKTKEELVELYPTVNELFNDPLMIEQAERVGIAFSDVSSSMLKATNGKAVTNLPVINRKYKNKCYMHIDVVQKGLFTYIKATFGTYKHGHQTFAYNGYEYALEKKKQINM